MISNFYSSWVDSLLWLGCRRDLEQTDLFAHPGEAASEKLLKNFNRCIACSVQNVTGHDCVVNNNYLYFADSVTGKQS